MSEFDLHSNIDDRIAFVIQEIEGDGTIPGEIIDTSGFESIVFIIQSGSMTSGVYQPLLEQGDDAGLSDATVLSSDETLGELKEFLMSNINSTLRIGSIGKSRYQRLSIVSIEAISQGTFGAVAVLGNPHTAPVPQTL